MSFLGLARTDDLLEPDFSETFILNIHIRSSAQNSNFAPPPVERPFDILDPSDRDKVTPCLFWCPICILWCQPSSAACLRNCITTNRPSFHKLPDHLSHTLIAKPSAIYNTAATAHGITCAVSLLNFPSAHSSGLRIFPLQRNLYSRLCLPP